MSNSSDTEGYRCLHCGMEIEGLAAARRHVETEGTGYDNPDNALMAVGWDE